VGARFTPEFIEAGRTKQVTAILHLRSGPHGVGLNPLTNVIYITSDNADTVAVINGATNKVLASIVVGLSPGAVAANPVTNTVFVANGRDDTVSVINGRTNQVVTTVPVGLNPQGIAVNALTNTIYVVNLNQSVSVLSYCPVQAASTGAPASCQT
jgi:YVTN family beta-propeller protein